MTTNRPEVFERLRVLSAQLYAVTIVSATEDFPQWHPEIREPYMCLITDMSREVRDGLQRIIGEPRNQTEQQAKRRRA